MKNSNLNNEYLDDEINLIEIFRTIYSSKKLLILIPLASALLAFIYLAQKEVKYQSTVIVEVGSYDSINGEKKLIEPVQSLIKKLNMNQISKNLNKLNLNSIEDNFLEINYTSPSPEFNENLINEAIIFSQESHAEILAKIVNSFSQKIMAIDINLKFLKNSIENQQESQKLNVISNIKLIDNKIPFLEAKIKYLLKLIPEEENNLLLLKSDSSALLLRASSSPTLQQIIYSYNEEIIDLENQIKILQLEKETLEMRVKFIEEGKFLSKSIEMFKLQREKDTLVLQSKLITGQKNQTQPIREVVTSEIKPKQLLTLLVGTIFGFMFSIFIVFIRQAFLKEQN